MALDVFETDRLSAERLSPAHFETLCRMHRDEAVMATLGGVRSDRETRDFLDKNLAHWDRHGFGLWILRDRASGEFTGRAGLRPVDIEGEAGVELAYALMAAYWGRGLATEISVRLLEIGFRHLGLDEIVCYTRADNHASRNVMQKRGFVFERDFVDSGLPHVLYRLTAADWRAALD